MTIKTLGDAAVLTADFSYADLQKLAKYNPKALVEVDPETKDEIFRIAVGSNGSLSRAGIVFTGANDQGNATCTLSMPANLSNEKKTEYIQEKFGYGLINLARNETCVTAAAQEIADDFNYVASRIENL